MIGTHLNEAILSGAKLEGAILLHVNAKSADFNGVDLTNTIIIDSDLSNTKSLTSNQISKAKICRSTIPHDIQVQLSDSCSDPLVIPWLDLSNSLRSK